MTIPAAGVSLTLSVDTRSLHRAHFAANAHNPSDGDPSSFTMSLLEAGTEITKGWDVCVGQTQTQCFANLEMDPGHATRTFVLQIHPRTQSSIDATVQVCVLDPLE